MGGGVIGGRGFSVVTGGLTGSTGGLIGSIGGLIGSTGGLKGSTGGLTGSTGFEGCVQHKSKKCSHLFFPKLK